MGSSSDDAEHHNGVVVVVKLPLVTVIAAAVPWLTPVAAPPSCLRRDVVAPLVIAMCATAPAAPSAVKRPADAAGAEGMLGRK